MTTTMTASDLGTIKNRLGLLNAQKNAFYPNRLLEITGETPTTASIMLKIPRANFYKEIIPLKRDKVLEKKVVDFVIAGDLAFELLNQNKNETLIWLASPNAEFFGDSPFEICLRGDGKKIIEWLLVRLGRKAGVAF